MSETLLGTSRVFLFGRKMDDLQLVESDIPVLSARLVATDGITANTLLVVDGVQTVAGDRVLLTRQSPPTANGIHTAAVAAWTRLPNHQQPTPGQVVDVTEGTPDNRGGWIRRWTANPNLFRFKKVQSGGNTNLGKNHQLGTQLQGASFARIYGFSYDGTYYDLPRPTLFLVHGEGELVTDPSPGDNAARAPTSPTDIGLAAADFQFADQLMVWAYDKADYTIRMDVETGMFEQVLLDMFFDGGGGVSGARVSGARVSGARVSGARVSGARVSGARVSGARVSGARGDGSD